MNEKINCRWMSLKLRSPYVLASLTLVSNVSLSKHVNYYKKVCDTGAGAIILPSVNPEVRGSSERNETIADCLTFDTGLNSSHRMGFTVLGPSVPNIVSLDYGINLARRVKECCDSVPVLGSVANIGTDMDIVNAVCRLCEAGIDGLELNFSCPNVVAKGTAQDGLSIKLLREIRKICDLPISLKITPYQDYSEIISSLTGEVDGLTFSNAYIGLIPPDIDRDNYCPFDRRMEWAPSGVYGPFERMLTFKNLTDYQKLAVEKRLSLACVGGIVSADEGIQALMLGADVVQLSSAVLWSGISVFKNFNNRLRSYLDKKGFDSVKQLKKVALPYINSCTDALPKPKIKKMRVNSGKCHKCLACSCCNRLCIAISQNADKTVDIDEELCSGCRMCRQLCPHAAIEEIEEE